MRLKQPYSALALLLIALVMVISGFDGSKLPYNPDARYSDAVTSHYPAALYLRESMQRGELPLWRDTIMADQPFAANPLNKVAYPPQWIGALLPPELHLNVMIVVHMLIAAFGMFALARALGVPDEAAALSMLAYALAPRVIGHMGAGHLDLLYALAWLPCLLWAIQHLSVTQRLVHALLVGLFGGLLILADVRLALFGLTLAAAFALTRVIAVRRLTLSWLAAPLITGGLAAGVILPLIGWQPYLTRAALTPTDANIFPITPVDLIGLFIAPPGNIETLTAVGGIALLLAIIGVIARRAWFWGGALLVAAWFAFGEAGGLWRALVDAFPPLLWFRVPSRAWLIVALIVPLLASFGFDAVLKWIENASPRVRRGLDHLAFLLAALGGVLGLALLILPLPASVAVSWLAVSTFGLAWFVALRHRITSARFAVIALIALGVELAAIGSSWLEWRPLNDAPPFTQILTDEGTYRVYSPTYSLEQDVAARLGLRVFGGVDPFQIAAVSAAIQAGGGITQAGYSVVQPPITTVDPADANRDAQIDTAILGAWGVTHLVAAYAIEHPQLELIVIDEATPAYVYANRDPALTTDFDEHPRWADGWANLPPSTAVQLAEQLAIIGLFVTFGTFTLVCALIFNAHRKATPA